MSGGGRGHSDGVRRPHEERPTRPPQDERVQGPEIPEDVVFSDLDKSVRGRLRTLSKDNADGVGRHLVMVGRLLDSEPELAYEHAQAAVRRAGRVDVVREAAGLAAYRTGRYAEALRELRTVRRLNGSSEHLPIMADCERGLGRPERAIALAQEPEAATLDVDGQVELAMVVSGARLDLGQAEAAVAAVSTPAVRAAVGVLAARVAQARAAALEADGRPDDAVAELAPYSVAELASAAGDVEEEDEIVVFDLDESDDESDDGIDDEVLADDHVGDDEEDGVDDADEDLEAGADGGPHGLEDVAGRSDREVVATAVDGPGADETGAETAQRAHGEPEGAA
ncbi:tetratricopeptide repeat protein [Cellulomonas sp. URHB0016]